MNKTVLYLQNACCIWTSPNLVYFCNNEATISGQVLPKFHISMKNESQHGTLLLLTVSLEMFMAINYSTWRLAEFSRPLIFVVSANPSWYSYTEEKKKKKKKENWTVA